ncbi:putative ABC transport system permease protein [Duganella sacchari]|uniref:Putative ABC transport system permease protein n=1 Tax=Duganella sacchari TaxID=551987 RepID=A0A1M7RDC6_9BURK|nr:ABC transporter permease [Duganella sacchari]SHN44139.1 putative ABC transport system permease protein [Duganella sacchari]
MFRNYLLTAWKVFMRRKLFTAINLLCIVLTLVVLMVVTALLQNTFAPSGVEGKSDRFVQMLMVRSVHTERAGMRSGTLGYKLIDQYLKPLKHAELVSATSFPQTVSVYQQNQVSELFMRLTDAEYWKILDFTVLQGRVLNADDVEQGRMVAVINESTARKLFPGQTYLGQKFSAGGQIFSVIGVVKDELHLNAFSDIWAPITSQPSSDYKNTLFGGYTAMMMARTPQEIPALKQEIIHAATTVQYDDPNSFNKTMFWGDSKLELFSRTLLVDQSEDGGVPKLLAGLVLLMLLFMTLPALNLINLNVGRIMERSSEIGVRKAFGATSRQLVAQLVMENVLLCLAGGVVGLVGAAGVLWWLEGSGLIPYLQVHLNLAVFGYGLLITLVFGVLSGVIPAWKMSRLAPVHALKGAA